MDNEQQQPQKSSSAVTWIIFIIIVIAIGVGLYFLLQDDVTYTNTAVGTTNVVNASVNSSLKGEHLTANRVGAKYEISNESIYFEVPSDWYTFFSDEIFSFTASNEDTSGILGITNEDTGFVMDISVLDYSGGAQLYLEEHPVKVGSLVRQNEVNIGSLYGILREVDSTNTESMEGSYSLNYLATVKNNLVQILFLGRTKDAIENSQSAISEVIQSFR